MCASADPAGSGVQVGGATRTVGIIGWPVAHSLSPAIHNAAFRAAGLDWVYVPLPVAPGSLAEALVGLAATGFAGANVTMPHKNEAADLIDELAEDARVLQAVNTIVVGPNGLVGDNTDAPGFARFLREEAGFDPSGKAAIVLGAGGAARAVALALAREGLVSLTVAARDVAKARLVTEALSGFATHVEVVAIDAVGAGRPDLFVNATPIGGDGRSLPPVPAIGPGMTVVDLLYHPSTTPLQVAATSAGAASFGGLGMLLYQAALSFERWTGLEAPFDVMARAAERSLAAKV